MEDYSNDWPSANTLKKYYTRRVDTSSPYGSNQVNIKDTPLILPTGTLYRDGDLDIINSGAPGSSGTLNDYVYITGDLDIGLTNQNFTLNLNGKAMPKPAIFNPPEVVEPELEEEYIVEYREIIT